MKPKQGGTVGSRSMVGNLTDEQERWLERQMECAPELAIIALTVDAGKMPRWDFMSFVQESIYEWADDDFVAFLKRKVAACGLVKRLNGRAVLTVRVVKLEWDKRRQWVSGEDPEKYVERCQKRKAIRRARHIEAVRHEEVVRELMAGARVMDKQKVRSKLLKELNEDRGAALKRQYGVKRKVSK